MRPTVVCSPSTLRTGVRWADRGSTGRWWAWPSIRPMPGTGWWAPTAASSPSEMLRSTARPAVSDSTDRSWAWRRLRAAPGIASSPTMAASSASAPASSTDRRRKFGLAAGGQGRLPTREEVRGALPTGDPADGFADQRSDGDHLHLEPIHHDSHRLSLPDPEWLGRAPFG